MAHQKQNLANREREIQGQGGWRTNGTLCAGGVDETAQCPDCQGVTLLALLDIRVQLISEASRIFNTAYVRRPVRTLTIFGE